MPTPTQKKGTATRPKSAAPAVPNHQMFQTTRGVVTHSYGTGPFAHEPLQVRVQGVCLLE